MAWRRIPDSGGRSKAIMMWRAGAGTSDICFCRCAASAAAYCGSGRGWGGLGALAADGGAYA